MPKSVFSLEFCGRGLTVETGEIAKQADGAVLVRYDDTVVLSTAVGARQAKEGLDFFPLTIGVEEKLYSVGKIPGGFLRREGRPTEHATLMARMIDRPIRPLFAEGFRNEVQVVNTIMSIDQDASVEMAAMLGASLALCISDIPFNGPIAGVKVGMVDGKLICDPTREQMEESTIDLTVAGTAEAINMVEAGAKEVSEEDMLAALAFGHEKIKELCTFQNEIIAAVGKPKREIELYELPASLVEKVEADFGPSIRRAVSIEKKLERYQAIDDLRDAAVAQYELLEYPDDKTKQNTLKQVKQIVKDIEANEVRRLIVEDKVRPDGRAVDEIRPLDTQIDLLPRVHGSAMFTRGETQVISTTTLGALNENQIIDDSTPETSKRFMHQYNFPPYSVGETGRMGSPGRREIGHGALAERALLQVIPDEETFPYAIRTVADVTESNGSSSQASICAGTMSLMAAGVPIKAPVAGIAMGLIMDEDSGQYTVLTDIQGMEDHFGDMDFKVAGTENGITALQMDIKVKGINQNILQEALGQAHTARLQILDNMLATLDKPREELSPYAPKTCIFKINPDKIKDIIGPGGKMINKIIEECDQVKIDVDDDGTVVIYHMDREAINKAADMIKDIAKEAKVGDIYHGKVNRIEKFGAFVNLFGKTDGLLHVSKLPMKRDGKVEDFFNLGDEIDVVVTEIGENGKVSIASCDYSYDPQAKPAPRTDRPARNNRERRDDQRGEHKGDSKPKVTVKRSRKPTYNDRRED